MSWYDAIAFCRWLTARAAERPDLLPKELDRSADWKITLPTEWQWEKAARGHDGRLYPWGDDYKSGFANVDETSGNRGPHTLQQTSAVGMYPEGKSPFDVEEMSGNVWEWCLNEYGDPNSTGEERSNTRVLRGGSWAFGSVDGAAASFRHRSNPFYRYYGCGFRVVAVSASP